jgi:hypothetical protein
MDEAVPPAPEGPPGMPRWVKVSLVVGAVLLVLVGAVLAFSAGEHGPGRHLPGGSGEGDGNHTGPHAEATELVPLPASSERTPPGPRR